MPFTQYGVLKWVRDFSRFGYAIRAFRLSLAASLMVTNLAGGPHNLIAKHAGDSVLTGSDSSASPLLVSTMDYALQVAPSMLTITDGQSGTSTISAFPLGGFVQERQQSELCDSWQLRGNPFSSQRGSSRQSDGSNNGAARPLELIRLTQPADDAEAPSAWRAFCFMWIWNSGEAAQASHTHG